MYSHTSRHTHTHSFTHRHPCVHTLLYAQGCPLQVPSPQPQARGITPLPPPQLSDPLPTHSPLPPWSNCSGVISGSKPQHALNHSLCVFFFSKIRMLWKPLSPLKASFFLVNSGLSCFINNAAPLSSQLQTWTSPCLEGSQWSPCLCRSKAAPGRGAVLTLSAQEAAMGSVTLSKAG